MLSLLKTNTFLLLLLSRTFYLEIVLYILVTLVLELKLL